MPLSFRFVRRALRALAVVPFTLAGACVPSTMARSTPAPHVAPSADYARLEREVLAELNRLRQDPRRYAAVLADMVPDYEGTLYYRGGRAPVRTAEGVEALREAMQVLHGQGGLPTLGSSAGLTWAARDHAADQGAAGSLGHRGGDGSTSVQRVTRYGHWTGRMSESIAYGRFSRGVDVVAMLLVDDGVRDRGHRRNLLDGTARIAGVACGPHARYGSICVIDQASGYVEQVATR